MHISNTAFLIIVYRHRNSDKLEKNKHVARCTDEAEIEFVCLVTF